MHARTPISVIAVLGLTLALAAPAAGGDEGTVTFRLTIRGEPVPTDTFTLAVNPDTGLIIDVGPLCGPGTEITSDKRVDCEATNYDVPVDSPVGTELAYTFARYVDYVATGGAAGYETLLEGTVTVMNSPQTVTLVYDYGLGLLPDTSMSP